MKIIIAGCGRVGALLGSRLSAEGHDVAVIDKDPKAFRLLGKGFKGQTVTGLVFDKDTLDKAGAERADAFIAVTSGDNSNVVSSTIARDIYRIPKVLARIYDPRRADIYRRLGIPTISSVSWSVNEIMSLTLHQSLARDATLGDGDVQLVKVSAPYPMIGRSVDDVTVPSEVLVVAVVRGGSSFIPATGTTFRDGDIIEFAVLTSAMPKFKRMIGL